MEHKTVKSSNIKSVGYDPNTNILEIIFSNDNHYSYEGVTQAEYNNLINAESVGKYFHANIKGKYKTTNLKPKEENG